MMFNNGTGIVVGDKISFEKELREVTAVIRNTAGISIVLWASKQSAGACMPSTWVEWKTGKPLYSRRGSDEKEKNKQANK